MVVVQIQPHQTSKHVHDCHHYEHSLPLVGLLLVVFLDEWLRALLGLFAHTRKKMQISNQPVSNYMSSSTCLRLHNYIYFNKSHVACFTPQLNQLFD
jgi:hypothetical protein